MRSIRHALVPAVAVAAVLAGCGGASSPPTEVARPSAEVASALASRGIDAAAWRTDFTRASVPLSEFRSGGPGRDGIPPVDDPRFTTVARASKELPAREPVLVVEGRKTVRAYPLRILVWHEIVNDELDGVPIAVTYCPLCNSSVVFDRRVDGRTLRFGTTGSLRRSDLVMWDDRTESWWQQITGEAVVGTLVGRRLRQLRSLTLSAGELRRTHPDAEVMTQDTGHERDYGRNPYVGYDEAASEPFLLEGRADRRLQPKERVLAVRRGRDAVVVPLALARRRGVVRFEAFGRRVVALYAPGVASALDAEEIRKARDVGTAALYEPRVDGRPLSLRPAEQPGQFVDRDGTVWDIAGRAVSGPGAGGRLPAVQHDEQFWFAFAAFLTGEVEIVR